MRTGTIIVSILLLSTASAIAGDIDAALRRAETDARTAVTSSSPTASAAARQRARSELRGVKAAGSPFNGLDAAAQRRAIDRAGRALNRQPDVGRETLRSRRTGLRPRTRLLGLGPREVTLDPSILDE